jgi:hypothetical protein
LIILGILGYLAAEPERRSVTALIPAFTGALLMICGVVAMKPSSRMHAMHAAATIGLLGFLFPAGRVVMKAIRGEAPSGLALFSQLGMALLCLAFVLLCVRSFIAARRDRIA